MFLNDAPMCERCRGISVFFFPPGEIGNDGAFDEKRDDGFVRNRGQQPEAEHSRRKSRQNQQQEVFGRQKGVNVIIPICFCFFILTISFLGDYVERNTRKTRPGPVDDDWISVERDFVARLSKRPTERQTASVLPRSFRLATKWQAQKTVRHVFGHVGMVEGKNVKTSRVFIIGI